MKVDLHDALEAVGPTVWDDLLGRARFRPPFMSWIWQHAWTRAFAPGRRLEIRTVSDGDGRLVAVLPLYEADPDVLRLIGGVDVSDYLDLIAEAGREEEVWVALLQARLASRALWDLHAVPGASATVALLPRLGESHALAVASAVEDRCPVLALPASWEAYLASLPGKHRHEITRKMRRLQREVPDARVSSAATRALVEARLGDFLQLHRRSRVGKAKFMDERMERFFHEATTALADRGALRLWFLDSDAGPLASFITLEWDDRVGLYNSGFDPARAALAPGLVLLAHVVQDAIARTKGRFDFLRGEERYKYEFGPVPEDVWNVRLGPRTPA